MVLFTASVEVRTRLLARTGPFTSSVVSGVEVPMLTPTFPINEMLFSASFITSDVPLPAVPPSVAPLISPSAYNLFAASVRKYGFKLVSRTEKLLSAITAALFAASTVSLAAESLI